ncbi:MAG: glycosyltransferase [Rhodospirillaceae bacterium]|nr:glycosyltransferase [Rhodospirillaceae bacterium]MBT7266817.1 glycosyltransferase [Rhodospirillaceae bacterium]
MIDKSYAFDGATPGTRALGGAEKAFAQLASALAARGHDVTAINNVEYQASVDGVLWVPFDTPRPPESDVVIAFRNPELLAEFDDPEIRSILWMWGTPKILNQPVNQKLLEKYDPAVVFVGEAQRRAWKSWRDFKEATIQPGIAEDYLVAKSGEDVPPIAIVTTHPLHGLSEMLTLWRDRIHPVNKKAELHIYSASLFVGNAADRLKDIYKEVAAAGDANVIVKSPGADPEMAAAYCRARLHFYPVIANEYYGSTLAESQASGTPAIIYRGDNEVGPLAERIANGQTGHIAPDDDAFVNLALQLLAEDPVMYQSLARDTKTLQASRNWQNAAIEFEALWKKEIA